MKHNLRHSLFITLAVILITSATTSAQQLSPEERAYKFRTSLFQTFAWKLGQMAQAKGQNNEAAFIKSAKDLAYLSGLIEEGFEIEDSLPEGTEAKPEIWEDYAKFQDRAANLTTLATNAATAGAMSDFNPRDFGSKACGSCHRDFRVKK